MTARRLKAAAGLALLVKAVADPAPEARAASERRPSLRRENALLRLFAITKIPLIWYVRPKVVAMDDEHVVVVVPLRRRTQNHHGTMYFGALAIGADLAAGLVAMRTIDDVRRRDGHKVSFVFKDAKGSFLRRPDGDVHFTCHDNDAVRRLIDQAVASGDREELTVPVTCTVPAKTGEAPVAEFALTISVKRKD